MTEHPSARTLRAALNTSLALGVPPTRDALTTHLLHGLAYTTGSALGMTPPTRAACLAAFRAPNRVGLSAGARAWSKHAIRSSAASASIASDNDVSSINGEKAEKGEKGRKGEKGGYWGTAHGSVATLNVRAEELFARVHDGATWRNLHWLPHGVLVYEVRVGEGYGMRWARDLSGLVDEQGGVRERREEEGREMEWVFRGFVEPMMKGGHEVGWRHW